jgi:hypothetical protein
LWKKLPDSLDSSPSRYRMIVIGYWNFHLNRVSANYRYRAADSTEVAISAFVIWHVTHGNEELDVLSVKYQVPIVAILVNMTVTMMMVMTV